jgi:hypothetical protein
LQDGTLGVSEGGNWKSTLGNPSKANPVVGRVAFWTDDETCKINVNTAAEGVFWDTPRTSSKEDVLAMSPNQPGPAEYQRYAGHPAMVSLSSALFPNQRYKAPGTQTTGRMGDYSNFGSLSALLRLSPKIISGDENPQSSRALGGRNMPAELSISGPPLPGPVAATLPYQTRHLYASPDDLLFSNWETTRAVPGKRWISLERRAMLTIRSKKCSCTAVFC